MSASALITVAPTGAETAKADAPALPVTLDELVSTAKACQAAGAAMVHVHIRDDEGKPTLDPGRLRETVAALRGEARKLTAAELAELRTHGLGGPAVMAEALKALAVARRSNNPTRMQDALRRVAQAAVTWQERI